MSQEVREVTPQSPLIQPEQPVILNDDSPPPEAAVTVAPIRHTGRRGFLPITTNTFDRCFISVVCFVAIHLFWMRFVEAFIPLFVATIISLILAVVIVRWG